MKIWVIGIVIIGILILGLIGYSLISSMQNTSNSMNADPTINEPMPDVEEGNFPDGKVILDTNSSVNITK